MVPCGVLPPGLVQKSEKETKNIVSIEMVTESYFIDKKSQKEMY